MGGDSQNRYVVTMAIKQTVNQMKVARSAGTGAHRQLAGELGFGTGGKGGNLFMAGRHPFDGPHAV